MTTRRDFICQSALTAASAVAFAELSHAEKPAAMTKPIVLSTWKHGIPANVGAWKVLAAKGAALDAVEQGVMVTEADLDCSSVGLGGNPDRDGHVTLDACIMNEKGECGSVACLQYIKHPVAVARKVMEKTPHVMLVGEGALRFALANGFSKEKAGLTPRAEKAWKDWLKTSQYKPIINVENHDTIGMLALDVHGNLSGSCTTSGLSFKMHGRVGDSPLIGSGLYVDNDVGAACATGVGEAVIRIAGSFLVVELMRHGASPLDACKKAIDRLVAKNPKYKEIQVGFLALNTKGRIGAYAVQKGFTYAVHDATGNHLKDADHYVQ